MGGLLRHPQNLSLLTQKAITMWEKRDNESDAAEDSYAEYVEQIKKSAGTDGRREFQEALLSDFLTWVWRGEPIPDVLMNHVADTLEELLYGNGIERVAEVLGPRPRSMPSREQRQLQFRVRKQFIKHKMEGMPRSENIAITSEICGVGERTVETIVSKHAAYEPYFKY